MILGTAVAFVTALVSVSWLLKYVSTHDFRGFAIYRVIAGALILVLITTGMMR